jgi:2'-deoxynucleoside 5'-phosphate N-hydrolase
MKRGYFAISFSDRKKFTKEIDYFVKAFAEQNTQLLVFVDKYHFKENQEREMMATAFKEIDNSDFLIAELTHKSIGVGIEIGYAFATKKPIIYVRQKGAEYSTTTAGCSVFVIEYENETDLVEKISQAIKEINL